MGKNLKGKEIGEGIVQQSNGLYVGRFVDRSGIRRSKRSKSLQVVRRWLSEASYGDRHSNLDNSTYMTVDAWFAYWIKIKEQTVRPNTVRNYRERYQHNIRQLIMGHSSIGITMNLYVHITDEEKYKEIERAADALKVI